MMMKLYSYFRSSAAYRVRIALALKEIPHELIPVHLLNNGGEQKTAEYRAINPQQLVPSLLNDDGEAITQSLAIIEYLEETHPERALLPIDAVGRARVRSIALLIAAEIHPLNNLRVLQYLSKHFGVSDEAKSAWYKHWIAESFSALEVLLSSPETGLCCHGDTPSIADCFLIPQVYNARRFECDLSPYPNIVRIADYCNTLPAFQQAAPESQIDSN